MANTRFGTRRSIVGCLAAALWLSGAGTVAWAQVETNPAAKFRGQSPYGWGQSLPSEPLAPFRTTASPWIVVSQESPSPAPGFASGSPQVAQIPVDPFAPQPLYAPMPGYADPGLSGLFMETPVIWQPYAAVQGLFGNVSSVGIAQLMMPLYQDGQSLFFADIRGRFDDSSNSEGNFGLAVRKMIDPTWFIGLNGFYDYRQTSYGNSFNQGTVGIEAMSVLWEARMNGYIPESGAKPANAISSAQLVGNTIFVSGGFERAYYGLDGEIGGLLWEEFGGNLELRGFVGGYWFDTGKSGFPTVAGPKGRLELRAYDLAWFGPGSRLTLGVEFQNDNVRDFQVAGLVRLEIPIGFFQPTRSLTRLERRMLDRIVRDNDIVTVARQAPAEVGIDSLTGRLLNNVTMVDATTANIPAAVVAAAGPNSTVVVDGFAGPISTNNVVVQSDQVFRGGGFKVIGSETGAVATFGTRPTITNASTVVDTVIMSNNSTVADLDLVGGQRAIFSGAALTGVLVSGNTVTRSFSHGIQFNSLDATSVIENNIVQSSGRDANGNIVNGNADGIRVNSLAGTVEGNVSVNNTQEGIDILALSGALRNNTASGNGLFGIGVGLGGNDFTGSITGNITNNNAEGGVSILASPVAGTLAGNIANDNGRQVDGTVVNANAFGFRLLGAGSLTGTVSGNTAANNTGRGFELNGPIAATGKVSANLAQANGAEGFAFLGNVAGEVSGNTALGNTGRGFFVSNLLASGQVKGNSALSNQSDGFFFNGTLAGTVEGNTSSGNGVAGSAIVDATANGYSIVLPNTGTFRSNVAFGNANNGFSGDNDNDFTNALGATFSNNVANQNGDKGYRGVNNGAAVNNTGSGNLGGGNTFP